MDSAAKQAHLRHYEKVLDPAFDDGGLTATLLVKALADRLYRVPSVAHFARLGLIDGN